MNSFDTLDTLYISFFYIYDSDCMDQMIMDSIEEWRKSGQFTHTQEQFSYGWIKALCSVSSCVMSVLEDSGYRDISIYGCNFKGKFVSPDILLQVKTIANEDSIKDNYVSYSIDPKLFNYLRERKSYPQHFLVLLVLPDNINKWINEVRHKEMKLKTCAYWASLLHASPVDGTNPFTIRIDKSNVFNRDSLYEILNKISHGEEIICNILP